MKTGSLENLNPQALKSLNANELKDLANDIRRFLVDNISQTGGHIGANLGVVELTIALHHIFDSPQDALIFDTGHQGYTHKILTGRAERFPSLNTYGGMNRFVTSTESSHDIIEASHAGTSISIALGMALGKKLSGKPGWTVAVIGDGAICEGIALEALNHASAEQDIKMAIILNDNGFAISPGFGAIHEYLQGRTIGTETPDALFSSLGYQVIGPVNGHDIDELLQAFETAKASQGVPLIHVKTEKGHGLSPAASHPFKMHFSFPFDPESGAAMPGFAVRGYQDVAGEVIAKAMSDDTNIVAITPSTLYATGLSGAFSAFPDRCFDPGMEEQHAMTLAVGLAKQNLKPVLFYQSTFMQRSFDQLFHDVCFTGLPMLLLAVRSGFAGYDNPTHHGIYDLSYLRCLPNLRMYYPKDGHELEYMLKNRLKNLTQPTLILMPYGPVDDFGPSAYSDEQDFFDTAEVLRDGKDILLLTVGNKIQSAFDAADKLAAENISSSVANLRIIKPLPETQLVQLMNRFSKVVTLEEGVLEGGVGSAIAALAADHGVKSDILRIGIDCKYVEPGSNAELCRIYGLDGDGVYHKIADRWYK